MYTENELTQLRTEMESNKQYRLMRVFYSDLHPGRAGCQYFYIIDMGRRVAVAAIAVFMYGSTIP